MTEDSRAVRVALIQSTRSWSPLETVADAVAVASTNRYLIYVERRSDLYRWSLAHPGGSYPLLRITARFLGVDYQRIAIGFRTLPDGTSIICKDPAAVEQPDQWALLDLPNAVSPEVAVQVIRDEIGYGRT
jgi:hypothetical protein